MCSNRSSKKVTKSRASMKPNKKKEKKQENARQAFSKAAS